MNTLQRLREAAAASLHGKPGAAHLLWARNLLGSPRGRLALLGAIVAAIALVAFLMQPPRVSVATVTRGEAVDVIYATGIVDYVRQARIAPIVTAPIERVLVTEGQRVRGGALLAQLEDGPARGTALQLDAQASTARLAAARVQQLYQRDFASRAAWDEARGQRDAANAAARSARARLADYAITAPFAGTILRRDAETGDQATPSRVLFVLADEGSLRVTAELDERDIARVAEGQSALIRADAFPGQTFEAMVNEITPQGDSATRVFRVRLQLDPQTLLRAGMTVEANLIAGRRENAMLAPSAALRENAVWVVENSRAQRRVIVRGASGLERVEVVEGLTAGELVILDPPAGLREGQRVRVRAAATP